MSFNSSDTKREKASKLMKVIFLSVILEIGLKGVNIVGLLIIMVT